MLSNVHETGVWFSILEQLKLEIGICSFYFVITAIYTVIWFINRNGSHKGGCKDLIVPWVITVLFMIATLVMYVNTEPLFIPDYEIESHYPGDHH